MIDFTLTDEQKQLQQGVRSFARDVLANARTLYNRQTDQTSRFQSTRPIYTAAVARGLIRGQIPLLLGGTSTSMIDAAIVVEELYSVEPAASLTILGTGLGLTPLILAGSQEQHERLLKPFLADVGEPLASLVHSEPGGTANWLQRGGKGLQTTARKVGDDWVINGEKVRNHVLLSHHLLKTDDTARSFGQPTVAAGTAMGQSCSVLYAGFLRTPEHHRTLLLTRLL